MKKRGGLVIVIIAAVALELLSAYQYYTMRDLLEKQLQGRAQTELTLKAVITKRALENTERSLKSHIREIRSNLSTPDSLSDILTWIVRFHPSRRGAGVSFKPGYYKQKGRLFEPYALRTDTDAIKAIEIGGSGFDYTRDGFYKDIMQRKSPGWVGPYDDKYLYQRLVSYAEPITEEHTGDTVAVFGVDIDTRFLAETLNNHHLYPSSFTILLTEDGKLIAAPKGAARERMADYVMHVINDSTVEKKRSDNGHVTIAGFNDPDDGDLGHVFYANFRGQPHWQIATVYYDHEVYGALRQLRLNMLMVMAVAFAVLGIIIYRFVRNSQRLQQSMLKQERIEGELQVARDIQAKMLPATWPPYPDRKDLDIYGLLEPAREVGGDLFDFFIRDEKLFFCIGDVSGKGVPAAMVMAVTHSLFRSHTVHGNNPAHIMHLLNETLCQGNDTNMFVTFFVGVLNLPTGRLRYCDAGHDKPLMVSEGRVSTLEAKANLPLGVFSDTRYDTEEYIVPAGCTLFLYTDGLTEAKNGSRQQFRLQRVVEQLAGSQGQPQTDATQTVKDMEQAVHDFVGKAEQSDDLTMLAIHYTPQQQQNVLEEQLVITNDVHQVPEMNQFVRAVLERLHIDEALAKKLRLAVEEAVVNVMEYAYAPGVEGTITLTIAADEKQLRFVITDSGIPFDPTESVKADTTLSAEDRPIGGLGILLVRELMDTINYERIDGMNILTLTKNIAL